MHSPAQSAIHTTQTENTMTKAMKHLNLNLYKLSLTWIVGALLAYLFAGCIVPQEAQAQVSHQMMPVVTSETGVTFTVTIPVN